MRPGLLPSPYPQAFMPSVAPFPQLNPMMRMYPAPHLNPAFFRPEGMSQPPTGTGSANGSNPNLSNPNDNENEDRER